MALLGLNQQVGNPSFLPANSVATNQLQDGAVTLAKILGTDWVSSIATSGYIKLPNGLIIQWGTANAGSVASAAFTFPLAFPTNPLSITGNIQGTNATIIFSVVFNSLSKTGCTIVKQYYAPGGSTTLTPGESVQWIAIGY